MSLKSNWQEAPKVVTTGRTVRYAAEPTAWADAAGNTVNLYWTVRRVSSMAFEILALTQAAAEAGAAALQREYTRKYARWTAETDTSVSPPAVRILKTNALLCTSSITPRLVEGSIWHIEATIDEEDIVVADHEPAYDEFEELFALADAREEADDGTAVILITDGYWDSVAEKIVAFYDVENIENFNPQLVVVQRRLGNNWVTVSNVTAGAGGVEFPYSQNLGFRVNYNNGEVISNTYITTDEPMPSISIIGDSFTFSPNDVNNLGQLELSIDVKASGAPRALAQIVVQSRWLVQTNTLLYPNAQPKILLMSDDVVRLSFVCYPIMASTSAFQDISVKAIFSGVREAMSTFDSVTFTCVGYLHTYETEVLEASPASTRIRIAVSSDIAPNIVARAQFAAQGVYQTRGWAVAYSPATIERVWQIPAATGYAYAIVAKFATLPAYVKSLSITGSMTDAASGLVGGFAAPNVSIAMPQTYITTVTEPTEGATHIAYTALQADETWDAQMLPVKKWNKGTGTWGSVTPTSGSGTPPNFSLAFNVNLNSDLLSAWNSAETEILSTFTTPDAVYTRIVSATWADDKLTIVFDQKHPTTFDPNDLAVWDGNDTLTWDGMGDVIVADLAADGATHAIQLGYANSDYSQTVNITTPSDT